MSLHHLCRLAAVLLVGLAPSAAGREPDRIVDVWPDRAPGETTRAPGDVLPRRPNEDPPATRITRITRPQLHVYRPQDPPADGAAVLILPGGGYNYVVVDKEGSEAAEWLNRLGITALVLHYRTKDGGGQPPWQRPLADTRRALRVVRAGGAGDGIDPRQVGVMGFSAGGQVAALVATAADDPIEPRQDDADRYSSRPDFTLLIYPWELLDPESGGLMAPIQITDRTPPTFLVHAGDDRSSSLGSIEFYAGLKRAGVAAELHVYQTGGHGYGLRPVPGTFIHTWPERAADWLRGRRLTRLAAPNP